jgi:RimJ/RimL family protein N-acetyltransferase
MVPRVFAPTLTQPCCEALLSTPEVRHGDFMSDQFDEGWALGGDGFDGGSAESDLEIDATVMGSHVRLRPLDTDDYPLLYFMEQDPVTSQRFRHRGHTVAPERYGEALWSGVDCQYAIDSLRDGTLIGVINIHNADQANLHARLAIMIRPDLRNRAWPLEALTLFVDHVFRAFPYRKLYADVTEVVFEAFKNGAGIDFDIEGRLVEHHWIEGRWQDLLVLAVHREKWAVREERKGESLAALLTAEVEAEGSGGAA